MASKEKRKKMKGFEIGPAATFSILLALLVGVFLFVAFTNTGQYLYDLREYLTELFGWDLDSEKDYYEIATTSRNALACAIKSVALGELHNCINIYKLPSGTSNGGTSGSIFPDIESLPQYDLVGRIASKDYKDFITGLATADDEKSEKNKFPNPIISCQKEASSTSIKDELAIPLVSNKDVAEESCLDGCLRYPEQDCNPEVSFRNYVGSKAVGLPGKAIQCDCSLSYDPDVMPQTPQTSQCPFNVGFTRSQLINSLKNRLIYLGLQGVSVSNCREVTISEDSLPEFLIQNSKQFQAIAQKCQCKLTYSNGGSEQYPVYAPTREDAEAICTSDKTETFFFQNYLESRGFTFDSKFSIENSEILNCEEIPSSLVWFYLPYETDTQGDNLWENYKCTNEISELNLQCTIQNFNLPQEVKGDAKERILKYADPDFLVYWQSFPTEQITWSYESDWKLTAAIIILSAIPPTKIAGAAGKTMLKFAFPKAIQKFGGRVLARSRGWIIKQFASDLAASMAKRIKKHPFRVFIRGVAFYSADDYMKIAEEQANSTLGKLEPVGNSLMLKSPYKEKDSHTLEQTTEGNVVVLEWGDEKIDVAHFVSPCYIDDMIVTKETIKCEQFTFNSKEDTVDCDNLKQDDQKLWDRIKRKLFGTEPDCDISTYLGITIPLLTDIDIISKTKIIDIIKAFRDDKNYKIWEPATEEESRRYYEEYGHDYIGWMPLDCEEWKNRVYSNDDKIGNCIDADNGQKWCYWGCAGLSCDKNTKLWTSENICGSETIVRDLTLTSVYWGKCENDPPHARNQIWADPETGKIKETFKSSNDLMESCLYYNPTGGVGDEDGIPNKIMIEKGRRQQILIDTGGDGYFDSYSFKECKTTAIAIKDVNKETSPNELNYCFDERKDFTFIEYGSTVLGATGAVIACLATGPIGWMAGTALFISSAVIEGEIAIDDWNGQWPGEKS